MSGRAMVRDSIAGPRVALASGRHLGAYPVVGGPGWTMIGQDGGQSIDLGDRTLFVFSDTMLEAREPAGNDAEMLFGRELRFLGNTAAIGTGRDLRQALAGARYLTDDAGRPRELIDATPEESAKGFRCWPAHGILLDGRVYVFYMGVLSEEVREAWDFQNQGLGLAVLDLATESCQRVTRDGDWCLWPNRWEDVHLGVQVLREGDHVYLFGSIRRDFETNHAILGRVEVSRIADPDAYQFLAGSSPDGAEWGEDLEEAHSLGPCAPEYSVSFNPYLGVYTMIYVEGERKMLMLRTADALTGPFGPPLTIGTVAHRPTSEMVFLAFEHPTFREEDGRVVHVSYSEPRFARNSLVKLRFP